MTKLMEKAVEALRALPKEQQEGFARFLLHELEQDRKWEKTTIDHADRAEKLVADVLEADRRGETELLDPDRL